MRPHFSTHFSLLALIPTAAIFFLGAFQGGFLSDDYVLLSRVETVALGEALEPHHYSLVRVALLKLAAAQILGPGALHLIAFVAHCLNSLLVLLVCRRALGMDATATAFATALFIFNPAGYEAVAWISAIGYVLVLTPLLLGLLLVAAPARSPIVTGLGFAVLQLLALAIWDWGILLGPLAGVYYLMARMDWTPGGLQRAAAMFLPAALCLVAVLAFKFSQGYSTGYRPEPDTWWLAARYLAGSTLMALLPNGTFTFAASLPGMALCVALVLALLFAAVRSAVCRTALVLCGICALPFVLFAAPASRYYYVATPFYYAAVTCAVLLLPSRKLGICLLAVYTGFALYWTAERSQRWLGAYRQAEQVRVDVLRLAPAEHFVLLNLPDSYGPPGFLFSPYVWRNGFSALGRGFARVNTPDTAIPWPMEQVPTVARTAVGRMYPNSTVLEVRLKGGDWRHFEVIRWPEPGARRSSGATD